MNEKTLAIMQAFWIGGLIAAVGAYPIYRLLLAMKSRQTVSQYAPEGHQQKQGTPTMGGLIICLGFLGAMMYYVIAGNEGRRDEVGGSHAFVLAAMLFLGFALIGFVDDYVVPRMIKGKRGLGWKQKIILEVLVGGLGAGLLLNWTFGLAFWLTLFLILFFSNAYNFSDGLDGLAGSLLLTMGFGFLSLQWHAGLGTDVMIVVAAMLGALVPFLVLNAPPAKMFMGDVGSLPIGAILGLTVSVMIVPALAPTPDSMAFMTSKLLLAQRIDITEAYRVYMPLATLILSFVMIAELVPVPLQILSVKLRKKKLFPYTPIHHAFENAGWPETRVVWLFAITQLLLSGAASYLFIWALQRGVAL